MNEIENRTMVVYHYDETGRCTGYSHVREGELAVIFESLLSEYDMQFLKKNHVTPAFV